MVVPSDIELIPFLEMSWANKLLDNINKKTILNMLTGSGFFIAKIGLLVSVKKFNHFL